MDALQYVLNQLATTRLTKREIAEGAGVQGRWLRLLAAGQIPEPGYHKVKALADFFLRVGDSPRYSRRDSSHGERAS